MSQYYAKQMVFLARCDLYSFPLQQNSVRLCVPYTFFVNVFAATAIFFAAKTIVETMGPLNEYSQML